MTLPSTIAVDGPAGSGKSTVSFALAQRLNYLFVDTGAFYRAVTLLALRRGLNPHDTAEMVALAEGAQFDMTPELRDDGRQYTLWADGADITLAIHSPEVEGAVSVISAMAGVRQAVLEIQRSLARRGRIIMAGRDIGTVVLPNADLKVYIDASLERRAERRYRQRLEAGEPADMDAIRAGLRQRDQIDSGREVAPLRRAPDAVYLDTSDLTLEEAIDAAHRLILHWKPTSSLP